MPTRPIRHGPYAPTACTAMIVASRAYIGLTVCATVASASNAISTAVSTAVGARRRHASDPVITSAITVTVGRGS